MQKSVLSLVILFSSTGNYFASHFFMGGEKFDTPHPEGYLFGENMDLNFLGNRPVQVKTRVFTPSWLNAQSSFNSWSNSCSFRTWRLHPTSLWRLWGVSSTLEKTLCAWSGKNNKALSQQHNVFVLLMRTELSNIPTVGIKMTLTLQWRREGSQRSSMVWSSPLTLTREWPSPSTVKHSRSSPTAWQCKALISNTETSFITSPFIDVWICAKTWTFLRLQTQTFYAKTRIVVLSP